MDIKDFLEEYDIKQDDLRWYFSKELGKSLLSYDGNEIELTRFIWSGELESALYRKEERFLEEKQQDLDSGRMDPAALRQLLNEIKMLKDERRILKAAY